MSVWDVPRTDQLPAGCSPALFLPRAPTPSRGPRFVSRVGTTSRCSVVLFALICLILGPLTHSPTRAWRGVGTWAPHFPAHSLPCLREANK